MTSGEPIRMSDIATLLAESYGISGTLSRLPGETTNYLVSTTDHERFVLKLAGEEQTTDFLELEHRAIERAHAANLVIALKFLRARSHESECGLR